MTHFSFYTFRHTCPTRWAAVMDPYTLAHLAGHAEFSITRRYVHPSEATVREAMENVEVAKGGHKIGHTAETVLSESQAEAFGVVRPE